MKRLERLCSLLVFCSPWLPGGEREGEQETKVIFYMLPFSIECFLEQFTTQAFILGSPIKNEPEMSSLLPPALNQTKIGVLQKTSFSELTLCLAYAGLEGGVGWGRGWPTPPLPPFQQCQTFRGIKDRKGSTHPAQLLCNPL